MSRKLLTILVASALALGAASTNALSAPASSTVRTMPAENLSPLPPGRAAGIKQAQGAQIDPLLAGGIVAGIFLVGVLLIGDNDDDDNGPITTTTGTN